MSREYQLRSRGGRLFTMILRLRRIYVRADNGFISDGLRARVYANTLAFSLSLFHPLSLPLASFVVSSRWILEIFLVRNIHRET